MGRIDELAEIADELSPEDRLLVQAVEDAAGAQARWDDAGVLEALAAAEPEDDRLAALILDLKLEAALRLRDLVSLEAMAGQAEALGRVRPKEARGAMLEAEAAGAIELARALARGLAEAGEDMGLVLARLEDSRTVGSRAVQLVGNAALALGEGYTDVRLIGTGTLSYVVSAVREASGERVACKLLNPGLDLSPQVRSRFAREAEVLRQLDHPALLKLLEVHAGDTVYFVTEFFPGAKLSNLVEQGRTLDAARVRRIGAQLADAVAHAHEKGVIHRDVQAANVLVDEEDRVKLIDFGMARLTESAGVTVKGAALGDWEHNAPELFIGTASEPSRRTDVFGIGVALYEAVTGAPPYAKVRGFSRERAPALAERAPDLPGDLVRAVDRCLEEDPEARFESAAAVRDALGG